MVLLEEGAGVLTAMMSRSQTGRVSLPRKMELTDSKNCPTAPGEEVERGVAPAPCSATAKKEDSAA
jgi:hypothetical protein